MPFPVIAVSEDGKWRIEIDRGTKCLHQQGYPLPNIFILPLPDVYWPQLPANAGIIGAIYAVGPDGATFDPPITLIITYDESLIHEGINEEDLVIAYWDDEAGEWVVFEDCVVDPETNTITVLISHFTHFAVFGYEEIVVPPAAFELSSLSISPAEVEVGGEVTVSVTVTNTGGQAGSYKLTIKVDEVTVTTKEETVAAGTSRTVTFVTTGDAAGTYTVDVNGQSGTFTVKALPAAFTTSTLIILPTEVDIGESVTISVRVANTGDLTGSYHVTLKIDNVVVATRDVTVAGGASEKVTLTTTKDVAGTYTVTVNGL